MAESLTEAATQVAMGTVALQDAFDSLKAIELHVRDGMVTSSKPQEVDLLEMLVETEMLWLDATTSTWQGPLVDYANLPGTPAALKRGLGVLVAYLQASNRPLPCGTKVKFAKLFTALASIMVSLGVSQAVVDGYVEKITGGVLYSELTLAEFEQAVDDQRREIVLDAWRDIEGQHVSPAVDAVAPTRASIAAALRVAADALEA